MKERLVHIAEEIADMSQEKSAEPVDFDAMIAGEATGNTGGSMPRYGLQSFQWIGTFHGMFLRFLKEEMKHVEDLAWNSNF